MVQMSDKRRHMSYSVIIASAQMSVEMQIAFWHERSMKKAGPLYEICKTRSGKRITIAAPADWDHVIKGQAGLDFIDMLCVYEVKTVDINDRGEVQPEIFKPYLDECLKRINQHINHRPDILLLRPDSLERARIGRFLLEKHQVRR